MGDSVQIREMYRGDFGFVMSMVRDEGWNQTEKDWEILTENKGNLCLFAFFNEVPAGTASAIVYSGETAWICMVIVKKMFRGKGISNALVKLLLGELADVPLVGLDATPAGRPVYENLGFHTESIFLRLFNPEVNPECFYSEIISPVNVSTRDIPEIIALDRLVSGTSRQFLIEAMVRNFPERSWVLNRNGVISGFALGRQGNRFNQIGPVLAQNDHDAMLLISTALQSLDGLPAGIDVPAEKPILIAWLEQKGFTVQRPFSRMYLHGNHPDADVEKRYAIAGPEFG